MTTAEDPQGSTTGSEGLPPRSASTGEGYEFSARENDVLDKLAERMHFVGLFGLAIGILVIVAGVFGHRPFAIVSGAFYALFGIWTHRASVSFREVVNTKGDDVRHLMHAIEDLRKLYTVQYWMCMIALAIAVGLVAISVFPPSR
jgi:hypothetical protein